MHEQQDRPCLRRLQPCTVQWRQRTAAVTVALLAGCGGGALESAVVGFLGTGGGQYFQDDPQVTGFQPVDCGGQPCALTLAVDAPPDPNTGVPAPVLFGASYAIKASGELPNCSNASGRVEGRRVTIGSCFSGQYASVNELVSDDGKLHLFNDFFPDMTTGVWVDVNDSSRRYKFIAFANSTATGCEITSSGSRAATMSVVVSNYGTVAFDPGTPLIPATRIDSLAVQGGDRWTGDFVGASGMRLSNGAVSIDLERRNETASCS
jgi:hypothetical protein